MAMCFIAQWRDSCQGPCVLRTVWGHGEGSPSILIPSLITEPCSANLKISHTKQLRATSLEMTLVKVRNSLVHIAPSIQGVQSAHAHSRGPKATLRRREQLSTAVRTATLRGMEGKPLQVAQASQLKSLTSSHPKAVVPPLHASVSFFAI